MESRLMTGEGIKRMVTVVAVIIVALFAGARSSGEPSSVCQHGEKLCTSIAPKNLATEIGETAEFKCAAPPTTNSTTLAWYFENGTRISDANESARFVDDSNGTLRIVNASLSDTAAYTCSVVATTAVSVGNSTSYLRVFAMPDYRREGLIIVGVNGVLLVVFIACSIQSVCRRRLDDRRQRRKNQQYEKTPAVDIVVTQQ
ncbi:uncharacterized protein LOC141910822 [Tubulanus polymorphus]|uniref:uncharacterized protein LOC141910822 n=1 Tax=Tubulanus polymorphus TaxID=672921 RepID=UPI003DA5DF38